MWADDILQVQKNPPLSCIQRVTCGYPGKMLNAPLRYDYICEHILCKMLMYCANCRLCVQADWVDLLKRKIQEGVRKH